MANPALRTRIQILLACSWEVMSLEPQFPPLERNGLWIFPAGVWGRILGTVFHAVSVP